MAPSINDQVGACIYILHMLLQRMELQRPGMLQELAQGISADRTAASTANVDGIFAEALRIVNLAQGQMQQASAD